jgi:hypothetical protein
MTMTNGNPGSNEAEYRRLLSELDRLEQEQREMDLRDERAVDNCQRRLEALRKQIATLCDSDPSKSPPRNRMGWVERS